MDIKKNTKIYLCSPSGIFTGGPMCMHQLGFFLKETLNLNVYMHYVPVKKKYRNLENPIHENFRHLNLDFAEKIENEEDNIVISPEDFFFLNYIKKFTKIQKMIWWLSLDNHYPSFYHVNYNKFTRFFINLPFYFIRSFNKFTNNYKGISTYAEYSKFVYRIFHKQDLLIASSALLNLSQSNYVHKYLLKLNYKSEELYDFLEDKFFESIDLNSINKENIICYNPAKATDFIKFFIKKNKHLKFVPLINMNRKEILDTLIKSKIYIDFGTHPGRDKIPREAVLLGNCILTNKKGSANNPVDISIPDRFKFEETKKNEKILNNIIEEIFNDYSNQFKNFLPYQLDVKNGKNIFKTQATNIFNKKEL